MTNISVMKALDVMVFIRNLTKIQVQQLEIQTRIMWILETTLSAPTHYQQNLGDYYHKAKQAPATLNLGVDTTFVDIYFKMLMSQ